MDARIGLAVVALAGACEAGSRTADTASPSLGDSGQPPGGTGDATFDDDADDGDSDGDGDGNGPSDDGTHLDVAVPETTSAGDEGGNGGACTKLDLLFVIDGSISMDVAQEKLAGAAEAFIAAIETELVGSADYHIGVVTTTAYAPNVAGCTAPGSLVVQTGGPGSSEAACGPFAAGDSFISPADADLAGKLGCMLGIGLGNGNVELTASAITDAVTGDGPGGCNAGFVRDDALLVVVLVTDTDDPSAYPPDMGSPGDPAAWFTAVANAKGGLETNIVMVSVIPPSNPTCTVEGNWSPLLPGKLDAPRLDAFTRMFTHHYVGDVCAEDYGTVLDEALTAIEAGCDDFEPVG
jgi:hypothetical protein